MKENTFIFDQYISEIAKVREESEHSGRAFLQTLLNEFCKDKNIQIIHEAKRDKQGRGAPDFKFLINNTELGYLENKKIGENLDVVLKSDQIKKYKTLTDNLILTDYLQWIWIHDGNIIKRVRLCEQSDLENSQIRLDKSKCQELSELINNFLSQKPQSIGSIEVLAKLLASPAYYIKDGIETELSRQAETKPGQLHNIYDTFRENLVNDMEIGEFADTFTQILIYSLFIAKLNKPNEAINIYKLEQCFPSQFSLLSDILKFFSSMERDDRYLAIKPFIERSVAVINSIDAFAFSQKLNSHSSQGIEKDPYIYFYEDFLTHYDKQTKINRGVYYTPPPVVHYIVKNLNEVVEKEFGIEGGLSAVGVKVLDFACGTGTFMLELYKQALQGVSPSDIGRRGKKRVIEHLLKEVFGFELMIPAYCVAHMRLSQFLIEEGFSFEGRLGAEKARIPVYLTNTLENIIKENAIKNKGNQQFSFASFIEAVQEEGEKAQKVKDDNQIFVIMGNPPYNGHSMNNNHYINQLLTGKDENGAYKEDGYYHIDGESMGERNTKWLQDDYVKFIRFAEEKVSKNPNGGVIGLITPHNFLDAPTFRAMRYHLTKTFDKIYLLDLHGNARKKEKAQDGTKDENVFEIMTGVCISLFIKNPNKSQKTKTNPTHCQIYRKDLFGPRQAKFEELYNNAQTQQWQAIKPKPPFYLLAEQNEKLEREYKKFWSLGDVFIKNGVGICTKRDSIVYQEQIEDLLKILNDFDKLDINEIKAKYPSERAESRDKKTQYAKTNIATYGIKEDFIKAANYRPFDQRYTYYTNKSKGFIAYPVYEVMQHFIKGPNVGLVFVRQVKEAIFEHCFISSLITNLRLTLSASGGAQVAPLYLYQESMGQQEKSVNFKPEFIKMIESNFGKLVYNSCPSASESRPPANSAAPIVGSNSGAKTITPEDVLGYIYAVLHSPTYRAKYLEFLKIDFPKIPFEGVSKERFFSLSAIGLELINAHLMRIIPKLNIGQPKTDGKEDYIAAKPEYKEASKRLYFNKTCYFDNVPKEVWEFKIGGYQVIDKYLKSRKGMNIFENLEHITNIINVLAFTTQKMAEIDKTK